MMLEIWYLECAGIFVYSVVVCSIGSNLCKTPPAMDLVG